MTGLPVSPGLEPTSPHLRMANSAQVATLPEAISMAASLYRIRPFFREGTRVREMVDLGFLAFSARLDELRHEEVSRA